MSLARPRRGPYALSCLMLTACTSDAKRRRIQPQLSLEIQLELKLRGNFSFPNRCLGIRPTYKPMSAPVRSGVSIAPNTLINIDSR